MHAFVRVNCRGHQASFVLYQNTINSLYHCLQPTVCTDMSEDTEDVKPKLSLVINYEGTRQSSLLLFRRVQQVLTTRGQKSL